MISAGGDGDDHDDDARDDCNEAYDKYRAKWRKGRL